MGEAFKTEYLHITVASCYTGEPFGSRVLLTTLLKAEYLHIAVLVGPLQKHTRLLTDYSSC